MELLAAPFEEELADDPEEDPDEDADEEVEEELDESEEDDESLLLDESCDFCSGPTAPPLRLSVR